MTLSLKIKYQTQCFGVKEFAETESNKDNITVLKMADNMAAKTIKTVNYGTALEMYVFRVTNSMKLLLPLTFAGQGFSLP